MSATRETPMSRALAQGLEENGATLTPIYSIGSLARRCDVVPQTVRDWIRKGFITPDLKDIETGRIAFSAPLVEEFVRRRQGVEAA